MEIERQFLIKKDAALPSLEDIPSTLITQGYVAFVPEIRVRVWDESRFILTTKSGAGLTRGEAELEISAEEYAAIKERLLPGTQVISKRRYHIPLEKGLTAELDVHAGHLEGLMYVEVEFPSEETAKAFAPPPWFGVELTEMTAFSSKLLATVKDFAQLAEKFPQLFQALS